MKFLNQENILVFFWLCTIMSVNSVYAYTLQIEQIDFYLSSFTIKKIFAIFNLIRFYIPFVLIPVLITILLSNRIKKPEIIIILFITYFLWQIFSLFLSDRFLEIPNIEFSAFDKKYSNNVASTWDSLQLTSCAINLLLIIYISKNLNLEKFNAKILIITMIFIGFISIYFTYNLIVESIQNNFKFVYGTNTLDPLEKSFEQANPRITGISRMILIYYFLIFSYLLKKNNKIILYILAILTVVLIYKMQARGTLVGVTLSIILLFFFFPIILKKKLKIFLLVIIFPIILFESYYLIKQNINYKDQAQQRLDNLNPNNRLIILGADSSGRLTIWKNIFFIIKEKKIILGYGPQADRALLLDFKNRYEKSGIAADKDKNMFAYDNNASNAFLYAYLCGGIMGLALIILIYIVTINLLIKKIFQEKLFSNKFPLQTFSAVLLIYLCFRGLFENSIALFGIDFIFFILAFVILNKNIFSVANINKENF
jgi:hypothetical protein